MACVRLFLKLDINCIFLYNYKCYNKVLANSISIQQVHIFS